MRKLLLTIFAIGLIATTWGFVEPISDCEPSIQNVEEKSELPTNTIVLWTKCCTFYVYGLTVSGGETIHCDYLQFIGTVSPGQSLTQSISDDNKTLYLKVQETYEKCGLRNNDSEHYLHGNRDGYLSYELD